MIEWLDDFYGSDDMRSTLLRQFLPVFSGYVTEAVGPVSSSFIQSLAESYVDRHLGSSRSQLQEVVKGSDNPLADLSRRFEEWEEKRPEKVARNELVRSANAAAVERMRESGVTKKVWRASGAETCPFCQSLDGTVIAVDGNYFEAGDELNPEGATAPIHFESSLGHPPIHQGCVCSVEAVTETESEPAIVQGQSLTHDEVFGSDTIIPPGQPFGDRRMHVISQRQGFDALPHVVSKDELDGFVAAGEREWFRGIEGGPNNPVRPLTDQYRTGDRVYQGHGVFGNGTYASAGDGYATLSDGSVVSGLSSRELATAYARDADGAVMRGTIRSDARVLEVTGEEALAWSRSGEWRTITESSMAQGYDVLLIRDGSRMYTKIAGEFADEFGDQVVILNRSAVRVQSEDLPGGS